MDNCNVILSICIPTYNRGQYLNSCLLSIFKQIENNFQVEVVVSDNNSDDNTSEVIKSFTHHTNFNYFKQNKNVGMSKNILDVISNAKGQFCWLIGDDDFILQGAIFEIFNLIQRNKNIDFFYVKPLGLQFQEYQKYKHIFDTSYYEALSIPIQYKIIENWEELISPKYSIIFMGELMASVFRKKIWSSYLIEPGDGFLSNVENSYVFSVVYANTFFGKKAIYVSTPMILVLDGVRDWWDRLGYILIVLVKDLLDLYKEKGLKDPILRDCYIAYITMTLPYVFKYIMFKSEYKDKISIKRYLSFLLAHPFLTIRALLLIVKNKFSETIRYIMPSTHKYLKYLIKNK